MEARTLTLDIWRMRESKICVYVFKREFRWKDRGRITPENAPNALFFFLILRIGVFIIIFVTFQLLVCTKCILVSHANISNLDFFSRFFSSDFDDSFKGLSKLRLT